MNVAKSPSVFRCTLRVATRTREEVRFRGFTPLVFRGRKSKPVETMMQNKTKQKKIVGKPGSTLAARQYLDAAETARLWSKVREREGHKRRGECIPLQNSFHTNDTVAGDSKITAWSASLNGCKNRCLIVRESVEDVSESVCEIDREESERKIERSCT